MKRRVKQHIMQAKTLLKLLFHLPLQKSFMEKILFVTDGINLNMTALDFAAYLGRLTHSKLTGIFLENLVDEQRLVLKETHNYSYLNYEVDEGSAAYVEKMNLIQQNVVKFEEACLKRDVRCNVHYNRSVPAEEIIKESRYADLIVADAAASFNKKYEGAPTDFIKDTLANAECPVIIAPENFEEINEIVFAYDDSASSVFAIKQFTYLFPELNDKKLTVLQVNDKDFTATAGKYNFKEWLKNHYGAIGFEVIIGNPDYEIFSCLLKKKNTIIVMGAYGRSAVSRYFKHSQADLLIKTLTQPIFIAHH